MWLEDEQDKCVDGLDETEHMSLAANVTGRRKEVLPGFSVRKKKIIMTRVLCNLGVGAGVT